MLINYCLLPLSIIRQNQFSGKSCTREGTSFQNIPILSSVLPPSSFPEHPTTNPPTNAPRRGGGKAPCLQQRAARSRRTAQRQTGASRSYGPPELVRARRRRNGTLATSGQLPPGASQRGLLRRENKAAWLVSSARSGRGDGPKPRACRRESGRSGGAGG